MQYKIHIPKPCAEKWEQMTPTEKGRYCKKCQKEIYDFTHLSNRQLMEKLENGASLCAKYRLDQLGVDLKSPSKFRLSALMLSLMGFLSLGPSATATTNVHIPTSERAEFKQVQSGKKPKQQEKVLVRGVVSDAEGALYGVNIRQKGASEGVVSDLNGEFEIEMSIGGEHKNVLEFSFVGYKNVELRIKSHTTKVEVLLEPEICVLGEVEVITGKRNVFQRFGNLFRRR
ncbi:carboxypeptidase-like regulatory domain-containing protein [Persicobacter diffluens]|uniref:CarboxypepD_reg-like domain-containing protein n=1 Tax=Persicobacter diffluens TaxID=981 RepID=A0AAN5AL80_9BACT|nr:hypothetical protein PEDI_11500 [Persicobacter diffluens]